MRILYLCPDQGIPVLGRRGCSTHVRETCNALQRAGHDVRVLCSLRGHDEGLHQNLHITEVRPRRLRMAGYDIRNAYHNKPLFREACRLIESNKIEAIYERFSLYSPAGTWLGRKYRLPRILEVNAFLTVEHQKKIYFPWLARGVEKYVARNAPALVVVSQPLQDSLEAMGVDGWRIHIMPMAVDIEHFSPNPESGVPIRHKHGLEGRLIVGYIGALTGWHGISLLPDMAAEILRHRKDFVILVVGGEPAHVERHRQRALRRGLQDHLIYTGSVPYSEVPAYINAMDMALVPDTNYWTCPTKMFEYQAAGIPTVAPRYPAILRAMDHGEEGMLFEPRNMKEAVERILTLAQDPALRREQGKKARARVIQTHSWQHNVEKIIALFEQMKRAPAAR